MRAKARITALAIGTAASIVVAGCSSSKGGGHTSAPAGGSSAGTAVQVTEKEFSISLAQKSLTAGTYTFQVNNSGSASHNLTVDGPGVSDKATSTIDPGGSSQLTVTLQQGSYELYCSIDGHKDRGMDLKIQVG